LFNVGSSGERVLAYRKSSLNQSFGTVFVLKDGSGNTESLFHLLRRVVRIVFPSNPNPSRTPLAIPNGANIVSARIDMAQHVSIASRLVLKYTTSGEHSSQSDQQQLEYSRTLQFKDPRTSRRHKKAIGPSILNFLMDSRSSSPDLIFDKNCDCVNDIPSQVIPGQNIDSRKLAAILRMKFGIGLYDISIMQDSYHIVAPRRLSMDEIAQCRRQR
jgi:hypothetical protein